MAFDKVFKRRLKTVRLKQRLMRSIITPVILIAILIPATKVAANPHESGIGTISVVGAVHVNGEVVRSGQTLFAPSSLQTLAHSESLIDFRNLVRLRLAPESALTVDAAGTQVSAGVSAGQLHWLVPQGVSLQLTTPDVGVQIAGDDPAVFDLATSECEGTTISVVAGRLTVKARSGERVLRAGDVLTTASTPPPAFHAKQKAGIFIIGGMVAALVLFAVTGGDNPPQETAFPAGCIDILSGQSTCR